jgi:hypothetical protein
MSASCVLMAAYCSACAAAPRACRRAAGRPSRRPSFRLARQVANMTGMPARRDAISRQASAPPRGSRSTLSLTEETRPIGVLQFAQRLARRVPGRLRFQPLAQEHGREPVGVIRDGKR